MKRRLRNIIIGVALIMFSLTDVSVAGDSVSISVSCSIPTIPGINAPLIAEETKDSDATKSVAEEEIIPVEEDKEEDKNEEGKDEEPSLIEEESEEIALAEGGPSSVIMRTIYSR